MTTPTGKSVNSRIRSRRRKARPARRTRLRAGLAALVALGGVGCAVVAWQPSDGPDGSTAAGSVPGAGSSDSRAGGIPSPRQTPNRPDETPGATPDAGSRKGRNKSQAKGGGSVSRDKRPDSSGIPRSGPGTFVVASGGSPKVGGGTVLHYRVEVETGLGLSLGDTAEDVERVLADPRGWIADGSTGFQRVDSGPTDFVVKVATPGTVDKVCAQYGLDTHGEYNCNVDQKVMVNLERWELATPVYADDVPSYRALIINHEVGHFLGHDHVTCPGKGEPAPAMMQQIKGMHGCVPNVWPYDKQGRLITGPAVS